MFIARADRDLVISRVEIKFSEVFSFAQTIVEVINAWNREVVFDSDVVQATIIDTHSHRSIFLFHKENRCTKRTA